MSSNLLENMKAASSRNPDNFPPNLLSLFDPITTNLFCKIHTVVQNKDMRRSAKKRKQTMKDQSYRRYVINYLSQFIASDTCGRLLLGLKDQEITSSFTIYEKKQVTVKACHIVDALNILVAKHVEEKPIPWTECCELVIIKNYTIVIRGRTVAD